MISASLIVLAYPQAIEDRGGVPQNVPCRRQIHGTLELIVEGNRGFADPAVAKKSRDDEELEIKREPLDC
jgi:hypothetical protein